MEKKKNCMLDELDNKIIDKYVEIASEYIDEMISKGKKIIYPKMWEKTPFYDMWYCRYLPGNLKVEVKRKLLDKYKGEEIEVEHDFDYTTALKVGEEFWRKQDK